MSAAGYTMHQTTIAKMEGGNRPTSIAEASAIAAIFSVPMAALFDTYEGQGYEDLAALSNQLAALAAEKVKLAERLIALDTEYASVQGQYDELQRQVDEEEEQARQEAAQDKDWQDFMDSDHSDEPSGEEDEG
ncbi:MAG: hypothetical protein JWR34_4333 [Mycobacterium sp.]|nr:hypothetical protein [Mycobacterium sp.]